MNPHVHRALVFFEQHRFGDAESELQRLVETNPGDGAAHAMLGLCLYLEGRRTDAVAHARKSLGLSPGLAGYERATRALLDSRPALAATRFPCLTLGPQSGPLPGLPPTMAQVQTSPAEIESLLERWRQFLEASLPERDTWISRGGHGVSPRPCPSETTAAWRPLSLLSQRRHDLRPTSRPGRRA